MQHRSRNLGVYATYSGHIGTLAKKKAKKKLKRVGHQKKISHIAGGTYHKHF